MLFSASIVIYETNEEDLNSTISSLLSNQEIGLIVIVNNGSHVDIKIKDSKIHLIQNSSNIGCGAAHNIAIKYIQQNYSHDYHVICNPDVIFDANVLSRAYHYMESNPDVGMIGPKIIFPNGDLYPSAKLLPSALAQFARYFIKPLSQFIKYELKEYKYDEDINIPFICGAFCVVAARVFDKVGYFDERFFLYQEDIDFSRRVHISFKTMMVPSIEIKHKLGRESHKRLKITIMHIISIIKFYNKWGWFIDSERSLINKKCLDSLDSINKRH